VNRGSFPSIEAAWQKEVCSYISTIMFSRPEQFQWPGTLSVIAVYTTGVFYATFVPPVEIDDVESEGGWPAEGCKEYRCL
jgi:hypothetical protein